MYNVKNFKVYERGLPNANESLKRYCEIRYENKF
jgi:hypothetical protein